MPDAIGMQKLAPVSGVCVRGLMTGSPSVLCFCVSVILCFSLVNNLPVFDVQHNNTSSPRLNSK